MDAMMAFWKDAASRVGAAASSGAAGFTGGGHAAPHLGAFPPGWSGGDPMGWMPTPEQLRRMQGGFLDAMAQASEQYMRSPQFLEAMKSSLESATQMRRQVEELVRKNMGASMGSPFATSGEASADVVAVLREMESRLNSRLDDLAARLEAIESPIETPGESSASTAKPDGGTRPRRSARG